MSLDVVTVESKSTHRALGTRRYAVLAMLAVLAVGGYFGVRELHANRQTTDDAQIEAITVPISVRVGGAVHRVHV